MASTRNVGSLCKALNKRGAPCGGYALLTSDFCFAHCPDRAVERREARARGGRARHGRRLGTVATGSQVHHLGTVGDVVQLLETAVKDVLTLETSISRARAVGYLAGIALRGLEVGEIEDRIARLEQHLGG